MSPGAQEMQIDVDRCLYRFLKQAFGSLLPEPVPPILFQRQRLDRGQVIETPHNGGELPANQPGVDFRHRLWRPRATKSRISSRSATRNLRVSAYRRAASDQNRANSPDVR